MSNNKLHAAALNLETHLKAYADLDAEAAELYAELKPLLKLVMEGRLRRLGSGARFRGDTALANEASRRMKRLSRRLQLFALSSQGEKRLP
ncbi:hypothetical protein [Pseudomonas sp. W5-36]|uniref:hypothetical protein n=1 Tax=Pseudomonas sp. W5-36 TaxID=3097455 RepID=UPI00397B0F3D